MVVISLGWHSPMAIALKKYKNSVIPAQAGTHSSIAFDDS